jgi:Spy/CpxP family protein refolding chaperone
MVIKELLTAILIFAVFFSSLSFSQKNSVVRKNQFRGGIMNELNLTKEQEEKVTKLRLDLQEKMIEMTSELKKKELEKKKVLLNENVSRDEMIKLTKDISAIKNQIELMRINHQMDIYDILDANQKTVWKEMQLNKGRFKERMKREMMDRMGHGHDEKIREEF